jgi:SAM-dependent methyltransferase
MLQWSEFGAEDSVLDVACGQGGLAIQVSKGEMLVCGVDLNMNALRRGRTHAERERVKVSFVACDAHCLPLRSGSLDKLFCSSSLEYFDDSRFLREARRVLKQNGRFVLTADSDTYPLGDVLREEFERKNGVFRFYSVQSLTLKFQEAGFVVLRAQYLLNSRVSDFFYRLGIVCEWKDLLWSITSMLVYYPCLISDSIIGDRNRGHTVIIQAK